MRCAGWFAMAVTWVHMPTHIDVLLGDYERVIAENERAITADERYAVHAGRVNFYALYRAHDHHFRIYGAMFAGRRATALAAADALAASLPEELLRVDTPPMADWLESFVPMRVHVLVRFGLWAEIIAEPLPADPELFCVTTALTHYAKGVALAACARVEESERERDRFLAAVARVPESRYLFNNTSIDILAIAGAMLDGEIEYRAGNYDAAWAHLRRAIELDDTLPYDEPWGWMQPTRHAYGALLLEQGEIEQAHEGVRRRPRTRRHAAASVPASKQRVEPARLSRVPDEVGSDRRGPADQAAAGSRFGARGRRDRVVVLLPDRAGALTPPARQRDATRRVWTRQTPARGR